MHQACTFSFRATFPSTCKVGSPLVIQALPEKDQPIMLSNQKHENYKTNKLHTRHVAPTALETKTHMLFNDVHNDPTNFGNETI